MVEIMQDYPEKDKPKTLAEAVQATASGLALAFLQRTLDEGGTIEIPSLGIVIDNKGTGNVVELAKSEYNVDENPTTNE